MSAWDVLPHAIDQAVKGTWVPLIATLIIFAGVALFIAAVVWILDRIL